MYLSKTLAALKRIIIAPTCPVCGKSLQTSESFICSGCALAAPYTKLWYNSQNAMQQRFLSLAPIEHAAALLWFSENSPWRKLIHQFKYHSQWFLAENMGCWLASELMSSNFFDGIDTIIPVPLYWQRRLIRGYNQTEHIAAGISRITSIPYNFKAVKRVINTPSQAQQGFFERWRDMDNIFAVTHPEQLIGRHLLLVDDVFTSGATITSLAQAIIKACNGNVKLSVATIAASSHLTDK